MINLSNVRGKPHSFKVFSMLHQFSLRPLVLGDCGCMSRVTVLISSIFPVSAASYGFLLPVKIFLRIIPMTLEF